MNVESITVFRPTGPLNRVWLMWEVVKKFYRLSDDAHLKEIAALEKQIEAFGEGDPSQQTLWDAAQSADQRHFANLSGNILIRATVLHLQTAFVEFAVKQVFKLVLPDKVIPPKPNLEKELIKPLKDVGAFTDFPTEYLENVSKYREVVRNQFAHGDWLELAKEVQNLDIEKAFLGTAKLMEHLQANLRCIRPNEYYEVYIEQAFPAEQVDRHPMLWKFLVELPESTQCASYESKAVYVAKKAAGTELMNDPNFRMSTNWAKLVTIDPAKLDCAKSITSEECRVWVLQRPRGFEANPSL